MSIEEFASTSWRVRNSFRDERTVRTLVFTEELDPLVFLYR
jgi:hypothetical protein